MTAVWFAFRLTLQLKLMYFSFRLPPSCTPARCRIVALHRQSTYCCAIFPSHITWDSEQLEQNKIPWERPLWLTKKDHKSSAETSDKNNPEFSIATEHDLLVEQFCVGFPLCLVSCFSVLKTLLCGNHIVSSSYNSITYWKPTGDFAAYFNLKQALY